MCQQENAINAKHKGKDEKKKLSLYNFLAFDYYNVVVIPSVNHKRRRNVFC